MTTRTAPTSQAVRLGRLTLAMLRYRAALMMWLFLLLGAAYPTGVVEFRADYLLVLIAIGASYVCATTVNDLADEDIDRVNHPNDPARPLVSGGARRNELLLVNVSSALVALASGILIGRTGAALVLIGLVVAYVYSAPPIRLSHRTYLAPVLLAVGYVVVPYLLGASVAGRTEGRHLLLTALICLFLARIVLKDFRDREGDSLYGRPTLLLRHGKTATCAVSFIALIGGDLALVLAIDGPVALTALIQLFVAPMVYMLFSLHGAADQNSEQVAIGIGARVGNGLLTAVLAWLLLSGSGAPQEQALAFVGVLALLYGLNFVSLRARPQDVLIGYKG